MNIVMNMNLEIPTKFFINKIFNTIELSNKNGFLKYVELTKENLEKYKHLMVVEE